jgi:hypothetical protein
MLQGITELRIDHVNCDSHITRELAEVIRKVKVSTFTICRCTFEDENNVSCVHVLLDACLAKNDLDVSLVRIELGPKYPRSFIWPENWTIIRYTAPPPPAGARRR